MSSGIWDALWFCVSATFKLSLESTADERYRSYRKGSYCGKHDNDGCRESNFLKRHMQTVNLAIHFTIIFKLPKNIVVKFVSLTFQREFLFESDIRISVRYVSECE